MSVPIRLAIVGCGSMAHAHAWNLRSVPEAEVVALCDTNPANLHRLHQEKFSASPAVRLYAGCDELLRHPPEGLRGVILVTPHAQHFEQAMTALEYGLDVLVEKPLVVTSAQARQLAEKVAATGRQLQVAFQAPFSAEFAYIREVLGREGLGQLQAISGVAFQDWRHFSGGTWRQDAAQAGGGMAFDTGAHLVNAITWLLDQPSSPSPATHRSALPAEVFCFMENRGLGVDLTTAAALRWNDGLVASLTICGATPGWQEAIWICGDEGRIGTGIHGAWVEHIDRSGQKIKYPPVTAPDETPQSNFVACLRGATEPKCPLRYGLLHIHLMEALYRSARENRPVRVEAL